MWTTLLLYTLLWPLSQQSKLSDLLLAADHIFEDAPNQDSEALKLMLKRTYNLNDDSDDHKIFKRSLDPNYPLFRDKQGVYLLSNIEDVLKIPVKFPNDINVLSSHNLLYITTLEANGTDPENQLANDLVLFQYSSIQGIKEIGRVPVLGGTKIALYSFRNETYLVSAEYEANNTPDSFQGSTVYKIMERNGRSYLEKIQILSVTQPNDVKFWEHQDQLYLVVGTNLGNDTLRSGVLIYRWLGYHFDCLQVIPGKNVKSVTPFTIGSVMYIAVANFHDEYGMVDTESEILQFHLQEMMFKPYQRIKTHGAQDISYFRFDSSTSKQSEHFIVVANSLSKIRNGALSALTESVLYKFTGDRFIPFQSFKLHGAKQWLPIKGPNDEFLLLAVHSYGVVGFQYDGWRFSQVSLQFGQTPFGDRIQSMRTFQYFGEIFITSADKSSYGNKINLWKLTFTNKNELEKKYNEIETWCSDISSKMANDNFEETLNTYNSYHKIRERAESLTAKDYNEETLDELEKLREETEKLEEMLVDTENNLETFKDNDTQKPIVLGSEHISSLDIICSTKDSCSFKNLKVSKLNGEDWSEFLSDAVSLEESLTEPVLEFEHVVVKDDLSSTMVNGHPSETLVDASSPTFINSELIVNGTVFIKGDFIVNGLFDGVLPDEDHLLLNEGSQTFEERLTVDFVKVENLKLSGRVNDELVEDLLESPQIELENSYKELKVNNMYIEGLINGRNLSQVLEDARTKSENQEVEGDLNIVSLEAEEVFIDSNEISNISIPELLRMYNENGCLSNTNEFTDTNMLSKREISSEDVNSAETIVIVEGFLKARDIINEDNSTSLLEIVTNSYLLNDSVVDSNFVFSDVVVGNIEAEVINDVPISSWVSKNSTETQQIDGRKEFRTDVYVQKEVAVDVINDVNLKELEEDVLRLTGDQVVFADVGFDTVDCYEIETNSTNFGTAFFNSVDGLEIKEGTRIGRLQVEDLIVFGDIDSVSWNNLLNDSVFNPDETVVGEKTISGTVQTETLHLNGKLNDLLFEEFVELASKDANKILLDRNVTLENPLTVDELNFEGFLDSTLKPNFELEWLLKDDTQIITGPMTFHNVEMKQGSNLMNETVNNISLRKLFTRSLKVDEDTKIKYLFTLDKVRAHRIDIGGTLSGADFNGSVVQSKSKATQEFSGEWFLNKGLVVNGSLVVQGQVSGLNLTSLCSLETPEKANLIVGGSVRLRHEPIVRDKVNGIDLLQKAQDIWMADTNTTLKGENLTFNRVEFHNKTTLLKSINGANMTHISKFYLSKTLNRVISAEYEFDELVIKKSCRMHTANVEGYVNGVNLTHWARNVLLQNEDQEIGEKLRFEIFQTNDLTLEGTINGMDLSKDVLRLDVEDAVVTGEKIFRDISVLNLTLGQGRKLQGVDVDAWRESIVKTTGEVVIKGDLTLGDSVFKGPFMVNGKVNDIHFDTQHILTTTGNQEVTAVKTFNSSNPNHPMKMESLEVSGRVSGVDLEDLIKNQAYSNRNLVFTQPKVFTKGLNADAIEVEGLLFGVNVSEMCHDVFNPVNVSAKRSDFYRLINQTQTLIDVVKGRSFFLDYFEMIQTLKPNVRAVVPTLDNEGNYLLAVFTQKMMKLQDWDDHSESFASTIVLLQLSDNITFATSEITDEGSFLYIERGTTAQVMKPQTSKEIEATETSCVASFQLKALNKSCIFVGQKRNSSRILCNSHLTDDLQTYQWLESKGTVQVAVINIEDDVYIAAIEKESVFDKTENTLLVYHFDPVLQHFYVFNTLGEVNPVAVSSIAYKNDYYLVSAGGHLPESVHNSVLSIFKYSKHHNAFVQAQSIRVDTPVDVHFAVLPSSELALYVLTSSPTKPFVAFLHRGIAGFVEETSGDSLYPGSNLYSFTDTQKRHFVVISGFGRGQVLRAGFKGN